ncbi:TIGR02594 family protein [Paraburkholderia sediminicola]
MNLNATQDVAEPVWMPVALAERGVRRFPTGETNPRIAEYNNHTNLIGYDDKVSWCSSFINWCLANAGVRGTGSALARSWLEWGKAIETPVYGCVAVLTRDDPNSWKGHVGFYVRHDAEFIHLFGGNQLDEVRELAYPLTSVLGYRWPESF